MSLRKKTTLVAKYFFLLLFLLFSLVYGWIAKNALVDTKQPSDAILILGAKAKLGPRENPCLVARVTHATQLYKQGYGKKLIFSGGTDRGTTNNQAQTMLSLARKLGVPTDAILLETNATSTYENLLFTQEILHLHRFSSLIIVSDPFHLPRASLVAKNLHISSSVSPATKSPCWQKNTYLSWYMFREVFATLYYAMMGRI